MNETATIRRLLIPFKKRKRRETILFVRPWYVRDEEDAVDAAPPFIHTFTNDDFINSFFDGIRKSGAAYSPDAFEKANRYRDYAAPPADMLDTGGAPRYPITGPKAIVRERPREADLEDYERPDGDIPLDHGIPNPANEPPWLRKLYLGLHRHFHLVTTELICGHFDHPRIAKGRKVEAGMTVRRLVPDSTTQRWEDWIPIDEEHGFWLEIADEAMTSLAVDPVSGKRVTIDPRDLPRFVLAPDEEAEKELFGRLEVTADDIARGKVELPSSVAHEPLSPIPAAIGEAASHSAYFAYLPVESQEKETSRIGEPVGLALVRRAREVLERGFLGQDKSDATSFSTANAVTAVKAMRARIEAPLRALLDVLVLKPRPASGTSFIRPVAREIVLEAMDRKDDSDDDLDTWWTAVESEGVNIALARDSVTRGIVNSDRAAFEAFMLDELHKALHQTFPEIGSTGAENAASEEVRRVIAVLMRRVRRCRITLMKAIADAIHAFNPSIDIDSGRIDEATVGSLSDELTAWLDADSSVGRSFIPRPWPPFSLESHMVIAHRHCATLEIILGELDDRGTGAGAAYDAVLVERGKNEPAPSPYLSSSFGFDLRAQPERGLFIFPTFAPTFISDRTGSIDDVIDAMDVRYRSGGDKVKSEARALGDAVRPRFDPRSLYAVWCFANVASDDPCEEAQFVWSRGTEVFSVAEPMDILGMRPVSIQLPDLKKLVRDIPRIDRARARPFAAVNIPRDSNVSTTDDMTETARAWGISMVCSFGIPVFTICAWVLFSIILSILLMIPGFAWLLLLKFCIPLPKR